MTKPGISQWYASGTSIQWQQQISVPDSSPTGRMGASVGVKRQAFKLDKDLGSEAELETQLSELSSVCRVEMTDYS